MNDIFKVTVPAYSTFVLNELTLHVYRSLPLSMEVASESLSNQITTPVRPPRSTNSRFFKPAIDFNNFLSSRTLQSREARRKRRCQE